MPASDVDDELLALVGGSPSPSPPPASTGKKRGASGGKKRRAKRTKRSRKSSDDEADDDDEEEDEEDEEQDAEGESEPDDEPHPYPLQGIYKDEADRERLLELPEIQREEEIAERREELSKRQQHVELARLYRQQQSGTAKGGKSSSAPRKAPKKKAAKRAAPKKKKQQQQRSDDDDDEDDEDSQAGSQDAEDSAPEEEVGSDYEEEKAARRTGRLRKGVGASASKTAKLKELQRRRKAKARGGRDVDESPGKRLGDHSAGSSEDDDDEDMDMDTDDEDGRSYATKSSRRKGARREDRDKPPTREELRLSEKRAWEPPSLETLNAARITRDMLLKHIYKTGWIDALEGCYVRMSVMVERRQTYRVLRITETREGSSYYDVADGRAFTNIYCTARYGRYSMGPLMLSQISNSPITEDEHRRYNMVQEERRKETHRPGPSNEAVIDSGEAWAAWANEIVSDAEALKNVRERKAAKEAFLSQKKSTGHPGPPPGPPPSRPSRGAAPGPGYDERAVADLNERNRRAEKERIYEVERRAAMAQRAALGMLPTAGSQPQSQVASNTATPKATEAAVAAAKVTANAPTSTPVISHLAADFDVDLGDF